MRVQEGRAARRQEWRLEKGWGRKAQALVGVTALLVATRGSVLVVDAAAVWQQLQLQHLQGQGVTFPLPMEAQLQEWRQPRQWLLPPQPVRQPQLQVQRQPARMQVDLRQLSLVADLTAGQRTSVGPLTVVSLHTYCNHSPRFPRAAPSPPQTHPTRQCRYLHPPGPRLRPPSRSDPD